MDRRELRYKVFKVMIKMLASRFVDRWWDYRHKPPLHAKSYGPATFLKLYRTTEFFLIVDDRHGPVARSLVAEMGSQACADSVLHYLDHRLMYPERRRTVNELRWYLFASLREANYQPIHSLGQELAQWHIVHRPSRKELLSWTRR